MLTIAYKIMTIFSLPERSVKIKYYIYFFFTTNVCEEVAAVKDGALEEAVPDDNGDDYNNMDKRKFLANQRNPIYF